MNITYVEYAPYGEDPSSYKATIDGKIWSIPFAEDNGHYQAIQEAIAGGLVVQPASDPLTPEQRAELEAREAYKESAISKLEALGLTRAEINTLI